jgi:chromosome segregation ATPase
MSSLAPQRRRRADVEEDEDADNLRNSQRTTPSESGKRARTNGYNASESPEPEISDAEGPQMPATNGNAVRGGSAHDENNLAEGEFQPGAIIRVKLTNFVTYEAAEFFPGPNLNMVIGPNGTGKSSLVCAICLGLGWGAKHLGRAGDVGEFVKHNTMEAFIEIELQGPKDGLNHIIKVKIIKENNAREWWLNKKKTSMKAIQDLTRSLSIQIDNLCQFLPQDKVSEFAALTPVELLHQTQRAAAPEEMQDWHSELKEHRKEQKELELRNSNDKEELEKLEARQDGLRAEVRKLEERREIEHQVAFLKMKRPFVEYRCARTEHLACKDRKTATQKRYQKLEERLQPTLENLNQRKAMRDQIGVVCKQRKQALRAAEQQADKCLSDYEAKKEEEVNIQQKRSAEVQADKHHKTEVTKQERKVLDLKNRMKEKPIEFDNVAFNDRIVSVANHLSTLCH